MSKFVNRFKPGKCKCFRRFVKLPNALSVFPVRFALPNGSWGRAGNWTVWLVPVAVSPRALRSQPDRGGRLSAASQPRDLRKIGCSTAPA